MELTTAEALRIHTEAMGDPEYKRRYIEIRTPEVRLLNAVGRYTSIDLALMFELPVKDINIILRGCV